MVVWVSEALRLGFQRGIEEHRSTCWADAYCFDERDCDGTELYEDACERCREEWERTSDD